LLAKRLDPPPSEQASHNSGPARPVPLVCPQDPKEPPRTNAREQRGWRLLVAFHARLGIIPSGPGTTAILSAFVSRTLGEFAMSEYRDGKARDRKVAQGVPPHPPACRG
jgi:hypothetical protein